MNIKKIIVNLSVAGLIAGGLSLTACSSGSSSSGGSPTIPTLSATADNVPNGYMFSNPLLSTVYESTVAGGLSGLALPQGANNAPLFTNAPMFADNITGAFVQQFNPANANPIIILTSSPEGNFGLLLNVGQFPAFEGKKAESVSDLSWNSYTFNQSGPLLSKGVFINDAAYVGTGESQGSFLLVQNSTESDVGYPVSGASPTACSTESASTRATVIAATMLSGDNDYIGIGTNDGEVLIYGVSGSNAGECSNLTSKSQAQSQYSLGSAITAMSFTATSTNNYGYFATASGQVWRIVADQNNNPLSFTQIAGVGSAFASLPTGTITSLYSDSNNNVYVGNATGMLYALAPTNSAGGVNTTWTSTSLGNTAVLSISATTNGNVIAVSGDTIFNVTF